MIIIIVIIIIIIWEDNIKMDFKEIGINTSNWVDSAQDRDYWRAHMNTYWISGFHKPWS